ncbi:MAG: hypothetical protein H0T43_07155, partial [Solirubrobacterales bacterium]|nr:hypothetical protein [Solirubrobacterales bacterium]
AEGTAASGGAGALQAAKTVLGRTLTDVNSTLERVLATVGLKLPAPQQPAADSGAAASASPDAIAAVLAPAQQALGGIVTLLDRLLGQR